VTRRIVEAPEQRGAWARLAIALARRGELGELPACADVRGLSWDRKLWVVACRTAGREWATAGLEQCPYCHKEAR
jgi:NAD(P)H-dependent flavin oxidoreductase YrpB (nitropropane dioxygenase family)